MIQLRTTLLQLLETNRLFAAGEVPPLVRKALRAAFKWL